MKTNPLIGESDIETAQNAAEALGGLYQLLSTKQEHAGLCMLIRPILHAIEDIAESEK